MKNYQIRILVLLFGFMQIFNLQAQIKEVEINAANILKIADQGRGGGLLSLAWDVHAHNSGNGAEDQQDQTLRIKVSNQSSLAEVLDPPNSRGSKILQIERNMWITKPGLKKPVAISPRQRLTGQVAIGDIAATNYAKDYNATYLRTEKIGNEDCHVLDLKATNRQSTYDRIIYWVSIKKGLAVQADFLSLSEKKLKSAIFEYNNRTTIAGKSASFISKMSISDALTDAKTVLEYSNIRSQSIPASEFDIGNLQ